MRALSCLLLFLLAFSYADVDHEDSWVEATDAKRTTDMAEPNLGGKYPIKRFSRNGRRLSFIKGELNRIRKKCNLSPIKDIDSKSMTEQIVNGVEYDLQIVTDGVDEASISMIRLNEGDVHPSHGPKAGDSPNKQGKTYQSDKYEIISIKPHPCRENSLVELDEEQPFGAQGLEIPEGLDMVTEEVQITPEQKAALPTNFDLREQLPSGRNAKATKVMNQGSCGSCWAFAAATAYAYRLNAKSNGRYDAVPSPQIGMSCSKRHQNRSPCTGGWFGDFWEAQIKHYVPGHWAIPYLGKSDTCQHTANSISYKAATRPGSTTRTYKNIRGVDAMMHEIYTNGAAGMALAAGPDAFKKYKSGVAQGGQSEKVSHAVVLIGWGTQDGIKYWLVQNSWGAGWGDNGFIKIERGTNALKCEDYGAITSYVADNLSCATSPLCKHGGAYKKNCSCQCAAGFSGSTCDKCAKTCVGYQYGSGTHIVNGACRCNCAGGFYTPNNLNGYGDCSHKWVVGGKVLGSSRRSSSAYTGDIPFTFYVDGKTPTDPLQRVKYGDIVVAVTAGDKPWTAAGGWNTEIRSPVCGDKRWPVTTCMGWFTHSSSGTLKIAKQGVYDLYYVKWLGKSEFGNDKGYGSDFELLGRITAGTAPTPKPTETPTRSPTRQPTRRPTRQPTTRRPTRQPTRRPTPRPTEPTRRRRWSGFFHRRRRTTTITRRRRWWSLAQKVETFEDNKVPEEDDKWKEDEPSEELAQGSGGDCNKTRRRRLDTHAKNTAGYYKQKCARRRAGTRRRRWWWIQEQSKFSATKPSNDLHAVTVSDYEAKALIQKAAAEGKLIDLK